MSATFHTPIVPGRAATGMSVNAGLAAPGLAGVEPRYEASRGGRAAALRRLTSSSLFDGRTEIEIEHGESVYRLRLTALGKLILTK